MDNTILDRLTEEQAEAIYEKLAFALNCDEEAKVLLKFYIFEMCKTMESFKVAVEVKRILEKASKGE